MDKKRFDSLIRKIEALDPDDGYAWNEWGLNLLHVASLKGGVDAVKELLEDTNVNSTSQSDDYTALHFAAAKGHVMVVNLLLAEGADVNVESSYGITPLHLASFGDRLTIVKKLVEHGGDVNVADKFGHYPLHFAAWNGANDILRYLMNVGVHYCLDNSGYSAMYHAAMEGHKDSLKLLLRAGIDLNFCRRDLLADLMERKKFSMIKTIIEYKQHRLFSRHIPIWENIGLESVQQRYRCDLLDFFIMNANFNFSVTEYYFYLISTPNISCDPDVLRRLLDFDCDVSLILNYKMSSIIDAIVLRDSVSRFIISKPNWSCPGKYIWFKENKEEVDSVTADCLSDIEVLKGMNIGDSSFTMHDVLVGDRDVAFRCVRGVGIQVIQEIDFGKTPLYGGIIHCKFKRVFRRVTLIDQLKNDCTEPAALLQLPDVAFDVIVKFLSDDDLEMLVKVSCDRMRLNFNLGDEFWDLYK